MSRSECEGARSLGIYRYLEYPIGSLVRDLFYLHVSSECSLCIPTKSFLTFTGHLPLPLSRSTREGATVRATVVLTGVVNYFGFSFSIFVLCCFMLFDTGLCVVFSASRPGGHVLHVFWCHAW